MPISSTSPYGRFSNRLKFILKVLDHQAQLKFRIVQTLRSIIKDTSSLELFMDAGIPNHHEFLGELISRIRLKALPKAPRDQDLFSIFSETFSSEKDSESIDQMDPAVFKRWQELFHEGDTLGQPDWNNLLKDARDALFLLSRMVQTIGLSRTIRNRTKADSFRNLPFFGLTLFVDQFLKVTQHEGGAELSSEGEPSQAYLSVCESLQQCLSILDQVYDHFHHFGVDLSSVYQVERLRALIQRCLILTHLLVNYHHPEFVQHFFSLLVRETL